MSFSLIPSIVVAVTLEGHFMFANESHDIRHRRNRSYASMSFDLGQGCCTTNYVR